MASLKFRTCSILRYPLALLGGFLAISIITSFSYTWQTTRDVLFPYFPKQEMVLPDHSVVGEVRQVRIAIEETGGSFYLAAIYEKILFTG